MHSHMTPKFFRGFPMDLSLSMLAEGKSDLTADAIAKQSSV